VVHIVEAEHDENELRLAFTPTERRAILDKYKQRVANRQGQRTDRGQLPADLPEVKPGQETRDVLARAAGFSSATQARNVKLVEDEGAPNVVEAMNKGIQARASAAPASCCRSSTGAAATGAKVTVPALLPPRSGRRLPTPACPSASR
jgi:hypothetical protein